MILVLLRRPFHHQRITQDVNPIPYLNKHRNKIIWRKQKFSHQPWGYSRSFTESNQTFYADFGIQNEDD